MLLVDWDVHHGNGTQDIFLDDPRVLYQQPSDRQPPDPLLSAPEPQFPQSRPPMCSLCILGIRVTTAHCCCCHCYCCCYRDDDGALLLSVVMTDTFRCTGTTVGGSTRAAPRAVRRRWGRARARASISTCRGIPAMSERPPVPRPPPQVQTTNTPCRPDHTHTLIPTTGRPCIA